MNTKVESEKFYEVHCKIGSEPIDISKLAAATYKIPNSMKCGACGDFEFQRVVCDNCMEKIEKDYKTLKPDMSLDDYMETVIMAHTLAGDQ